MAGIISGITHPELVVGIAGPIGIDIEVITTSIEECLESVGYKTVQIRITDEIKSIPSKIKVPTKNDYHSVIRYKMAHASEICRKNSDSAYLMRIAIDSIQRERAEFLLSASPTPGGKKPKDVKADDLVPQKVAYIIRQIKRPQEVMLLREVYGRQFVLVSAYGSEHDRKLVLEEKLTRSMNLGTKPAKIRALAEELVQIDADEADDRFGQHMRDAFHLADVFVDGIAKGPMKHKVSRFFDALFGLNEIAPTKHEYGMYAAKSASLRSSDLSRQVGAAIFNDNGEILTQGCNEVPRAFGGTYWDGEEPDFRDIKIGNDPNDIIKSEVIRDLLERLSEAKLLAPAASGNASDLVERLTNGKSLTNKGAGAGCLKGALITDLTEYGRVVHAEMGALCDAARCGVSVRGAILFCTTFPCHNCTKHIISAGIKRVIYMEPYPKSRAKELHQNEIEIERPSSSKVSFLPFLGISPYRYRDIFQKDRRKSGGFARKWYHGEPRPMIEVMAPTHIELENLALVGLIGQITSG
jgi:deoxycytidylate deaminase